MIDPSAALSALADPARWRIVEVLAERPRPVGVVAELCGLRQPQATKHLQTLERAGLARSLRSGHRRVYSLRPDALEAVAAELARVVAVATENAGARETFEQYAAGVEEESRAADRAGWADGRAYVFRRTLAASRVAVWARLTEPAWLRTWWSPDDLRLSRIEFGARPGLPIVQEYRDADPAARVSDDVIGRAEGVIDEVRDRERLAFELSPLLPDGSRAFTAHYEWLLSDAPDGTELEVRMLLADSTPPSAEFVAGISLGWEQSLTRLAAALAASPIDSPIDGTTAATHPTATPQEES